MTSGDTRIVERLTEVAGLAPDEARLFLSALEAGKVGTKGSGAKALAARGLLIASSDEKTYFPVHPRLALSNLFRSMGERSSPEMRERRKMIDSLTSELIPVYEAGRRSR